MKHLHKCGKYLINLDSIHSIEDVSRGFMPAPGYRGSDIPTPPNFIVHIGNEFGVGELRIMDYPKDKVDVLHADLVKAWQEYLEEIT